MSKRKKYLRLLSLTLILTAVAGFFLLWQKKNSFEVTSSQEVKKSQEGAALASGLAEDTGPRSPISGLSCIDARRRPFAVMLSNDAEARPLSGLSGADLIFEMQVVENMITRVMAIYVCGNPKELGSIRSAREGFVPLARGVDAILVHWGGEHSVLEKLNAGIMDNLDGLKDEVVTFFRKAGIPAPHNGFSSITRLINAATKAGYRLEDKFVGYPHLADKSMQIKAMTLAIGYVGQYAVKYEYDPTGNSYLRWRGGTKEIDKNTGRQVAAKNVVIMRSASQAISEQYNSVQVEGQGQATVYRNGEEISATWEKNAQDQTKKLFFYDNQRQEIKFVPGQIWVEIVDPGQSATWL